MLCRETARLGVKELAIGRIETTHGALGCGCLAVKIAGHGGCRKRADERHIHLRRGKRRRASRLGFVRARGTGVIGRRGDPVAFGFVRIADCLQGSRVRRRRLECLFIRMTRGRPLVRIRL